MWRFLGFLFIVSISFFSCSNAADLQETAAQEGEMKTLKNIISGNESNISWTGELEGDRLYFDVYRDAEYVSSEVALTPTVVNVAGGLGKAVYPELQGFGSLDTSSMPYDIKVLVNDFAKALSANVYEGPEKFFDEKYIFNYVFFRRDMINDWKKFFGVDFPQALSLEVYNDLKSSNNTEKSSDNTGKNGEGTESNNDDGAVSAASEVMRRKTAAKAEPARPVKIYFSFLWILSISFRAS